MENTQIQDNSQMINNIPDLGEKYQFATGWDIWYHSWY